MLTSSIYYKDLGLVNTKEMFSKAISAGYAIPAYNFNNMEQLQAIIIGCVQSSSPVILQVSNSARKYADPVLLPHMVKGAVEMARSMGSSIPIALHLDHGKNLELVKECIDSGFSSVMFDGSHLLFNENVRLTAAAVEYAHAKGVTVEGELGILAGIEDEDNSAEHYTRPEEVEEFVSKTKVDSLAISIGTSHGAHKFKLKPGQDIPSLRFDILEIIEKKLPGYPIVLHGASSVIAEHVNMINMYGGKLESAVGVPMEQLLRATKSAVCKINIDSDGRLAMTAMVRRVLSEDPSSFDPRKYLGAARDEMINLIKDKNINILGSAGKG